MVLENLSKEELKELCKAKGLQDYANLSKSKLIRMLNSLENPEEHKKLVEDVAEIIAAMPSEKEVEEIAKELEPLDKKVLSPQATKWKMHLRQLNITPQEYLTRFPDHMYKRYIEELI